MSGPERITAALFGLTGQSGASRRAAMQGFGTPDVPIGVRESVSR